MSESNREPDSPERNAKLAAEAKKVIDDNRRADELHVIADAGETVDIYDWWFSGEEGDVITWLALK